MRIATILSLAVLFVLTTNSAQAIDILWVQSTTNSQNAGNPGIDPSPSWRTLLEDGGANTVTTFDGDTFNWRLSQQADIDYVESFDLIFQVRSNSTYNSVRNHGAIWNALSVPMINTNAFLTTGAFVGNNSWNWIELAGDPGFDGTSRNHGNARIFDVVDASSPIWDGVTLASGDTQTPILFEDDSGAAGMELNIDGRDGSPTNGTAMVYKNGVESLAVRDNSGEEVNAIAFVPADTLRPGGAAQFFYGMGDFGSVPEELLTADGETVLLNMIDILTGGDGGTDPLGDFNGDQIVNLADYTVWRNNLGSDRSVLPVGSTASGTGTIDATDYQTWRENFGVEYSTSPSVDGVPTPEPTTVALLAVGLIGIAIARRRSRS